MKTRTTQQEVMLVLNTTFSQREWCPLNSANNKFQSKEEQLLEACWNGMLNDMLPEIMLHAANGEKLFLWNIRQSKSLIMEFGDSPGPVEKTSSLDPYNFLQTMMYN